MAPALPLNNKPNFLKCLDQITTGKVSRRLRHSQKQEGTGTETTYRHLCISWEVPQEFQLHRARQIGFVTESYLSNVFRKNAVGKFCKPNARKTLIESK